MPSGTTHFWPGGIPISIKVQPEPDLSRSQRQEECKGWSLFVSENWATREEADISDDDVDYETRQRRQLVLQWVDAEQSFRNSYHDRAPAPTSQRQYPLEVTANIDSFPNYALMCLTPVSQNHPINRLRWTKWLIFLNRFDGARENVLVDDDPEHPLVLLEEISSSSLQKEDAARWMYLENADFRHISMTRSGVVMYDVSAYFFVDQKALEQGLLSVVSFANNGEIEEGLVRPYGLMHLLAYLERKHPVWELPGAGAPSLRVQIDMDLPILEILEIAKAHYPSEFVSPSLADDVEYYAPGYLALEAQGKATEFDPEVLLEELR